MREPRNHYAHVVFAQRKGLSALLFLLIALNPMAAYADNALHKAIIKGKEAKALRLIKKGKGVEELADNGFTPLLLATTRDQVAVLTALVDAGVSLDTQIGPSGFTALHSAVNAGSFNGVRVLVAGGANIEAADIDGGTPWIAAVGRSSPKIAMLMLDVARQPLSTESLEAAVRITSESGSLDLLDRLLPRLGGYRPALFELDQLGYGHIHHLARLGRTDSLMAIVKAGANIDLQVGDGSKDQKGVTALWVALHNEHDELADVLVQQGADPMLEGEQMISPLRMQLQNGKIEQVDAMIANSPNVRRVEFRQVESLGNFLRSTMDPISMPALFAECGSSYQAIEGGANSTMVFNGGTANASHAASKDFDKSSIMQLPNLNIRTAIKIRSTDPEVTIVLRSRISPDLNSCQVIHVDGSYSALLGTTGESRLVSVLVNPTAQQLPIPFEAVIAYQAGRATYYYLSNDQWFEIQMD